MVDFSDRLKMLRTQFGMTQADLATKLRVTKSVVSYYELHERTPSPDILIKLSGIFHVSTDYLLGLDNQRCIDVSGLSDDDVKLMISFVDRLKNK